MLPVHQRAAGRYPQARHIAPGEGCGAHQRNDGMLAGSFALSRLFTPSRRYLRLTSRAFRRPSSSRQEAAYRPSVPRRAVRLKRVADVSRACAEHVQGMRLGALAVLFAFE